MHVLSQCESMCYENLGNVSIVGIDLLRCFQNHHIWTMVKSLSVEDRGRRYFVTGGAGFIGSHLADSLLANEQVSGVTLYDNFSSGREWHYEQHRGDSRFCVLRADVRN